MKVIAVPLDGTEAYEENASLGEKGCLAGKLRSKALLYFVVMAVVDVAASAVPSAAEPPPSVAGMLPCAYVEMAAACAHGLSYVSAKEREWMSPLFA